ncbi:MAG TPA: ABC transporter substrate-binding protein [Gemmatimonadales bacterium]|nr:ABC transporter substrate-binding protein [Gemmatimonadales bacterium]
MRVVSLLPAATEIVAAIGGVGLLVGVSHECDYPPAVQNLPHVTRSRIDPQLPAREIDRQLAEAKRTGTPAVEVDFPTLARLRPDVLIGQSVCNVCAVGEGELARVVPGLHPTPWVVTLHPHTLDDVLADVLQLGQALALQEEAQELVAGLRHRVRRLAAQASPPSKPRVLVLEWLDPPYVAGHWVPELVALAGGEDVGNTPGAPSVPRSWSALAERAPDVVVIALCGFDIERARREHAAVTDPAARAVLDRRQEFIDGNAHTSRPGPRLVDAAEHLARLFHG